MKQLNKYIAICLSASLVSFSGVAEADDLRDVLGSAFGIGISESMSYKTDGEKGKYICSSSTASPTINESVQIRCVGVPLAGDTVVIPPVFTITDKPTEGGKKTKRINGITYTYHPEDPVEVHPVSAEVEYNVYEGSTTMGNDAYLDFLKNYDASTFSTVDVASSTSSNSFGTTEYSNGDLDGINLSSGTVTNASNDFCGIKGSEDFVFNPDNYGINSDTNVDLEDYNKGTLNDVLNDSDESFNSGQNDWASAAGESEGLSNLDDYFGESTNSNGDSLMTEDLLGTEAMNISNIADKIVNDNGGVNSDGYLYDGDGNVYGSADVTGLTAFTDGSNELNEILEAGGWIDERGNVYDANGNLIGYISSGVGNENMSADDMSGFDQILSMFNDVLGEFSSDTNSSFGSNSSFFGSSESGNMLDILKSTFGMDSEESIKAETLSPQEMFNTARDFLSKLGYTDEQLASGMNYDKDSAYTEPEKAWDLNRITTMQKHYNIETGFTPSGKSSLIDASGRFSAITK